MFGQEGRPEPGRSNSARCLAGTGSLAFPSRLMACYLAFSSPEPGRILFSPGGSRGWGVPGDGAAREWTIDTSK